MNVERPLTPLIKSKHGSTSEKDFVKLKLRRDTTSYKLDLYELKMALSANGKPEEFLLFFCNFNITIVASGMLEISAIGAIPFYACSWRRVASV